MKRITYILFTLLLSSCFYDAVYNFDKEDLAWMEPYDKRDTIIFASEEGMDTMIVDNKTLHDDHNALFVPNEATSVYNANGYIQNVVFHNKAHFECKLMIVKKNEKVMKLYLLFKERALKFVELLWMGLNMMMPLLWMIVIPNLYTMLSIIAIISSGANQKACYSTNIGMEKSIRFTRSYSIRERIEQ